MIVTASYSDGTSNSINGYYVSYDCSQTVQKTVTISYGGFKDTLSVDVSLNNNIVFEYIFQDGNIDSSDLTFLRKKLLSISTFTQHESLLADVNHDGIVNIKDYMRLKKYCAGMNVELA